MADRPEMLASPAFAALKPSGRRALHVIEDAPEYIVMQARLGKLVDYVDESSWRFGFVLSAIVAAEMALIAAAVLSN